MIDDLITRLRAYRAHDATADALLDEAAAEIERLRAEARSAIWECETCGAKFYKIGPAVMYDGVTQCTKCVEVEVLSAEVERLRAALGESV